MVSNNWWGYVHVNGEIQVKRYFGMKSIQDAKESSFAKQVFGPFPAKHREDAIRKIKEQINNQ